MKTVVLDTNVLLSDPKIILSFPSSEVAIPEVVLGELDKIKISRTDADVRFRGREVSRIIFELSENGSLVDGVELPDGGTLRIIPFSSETTLPEGMSTRNTDDKILACAWQLHQNARPGDQVVLVTNDLNMLLKAQTLGLPFEQWDDGGDGGWSKKYVIRPFQRYKVPLAILAASVAVFLGVFFYAQTLNSGNSSLPENYQAVLTAEQTEAIDSLNALKKDPTNKDLLLKVAHYFDDQSQTAAIHGSSAESMTWAKEGIEYYERYLAQNPTDAERVEALVDLAILQFYNGQTDIAIQDIGNALTISPNHLKANYNLGVFYYQGRRDYERALAQLNRVVDLTKNNPDNKEIYDRATELIKQIETEKANGGSSDATNTNLSD